MATLLASEINSTGGGITNPTARAQIVCSLKDEKTQDISSLNVRGVYRT